MLVKRLINFCYIQTRADAHTLNSRSIYVSVCKYWQIKWITASVHEYIHIHNTTRCKPINIFAPITTASAGLIINTIRNECCLRPCRSLYTYHEHHKLLQNSNLDFDDFHSQYLLPKPNFVHLVLSKAPNLKKSVYMYVIWWSDLTCSD